MFRDDCELFDMTHSRMWHSSKVQKYFLWVSTSYKKTLNPTLWWHMYFILKFIVKVTQSKSFKRVETCKYCDFQVKSIVMSLLPFRLVIFDSLFHSCVFVEQPIMFYSISRLSYCPCVLLLFTQMNVLFTGKLTIF